MHTNSFVTFSSRSKNLKSLSSLGSVVKGNPFLRTTKDGKTIQVTGRFRKAIRKQLIEESLKKPNIAEPTRLVVVPRYKSALSLLTNPPTNTRRLKYAQVRDPLNAKILRSGLRFDDKFTKISNGRIRLETQDLHTSTRMRHLSEAHQERGRLFAHLPRWREIVANQHRKNNEYI